MRLGGSLFGGCVPRGLLCRGGDVAIGFGAMHHGIGDPLGAVAPFVAGPLALGVEIGFFVRWKAFDLGLVQIGFKIVVMFCRGAQAFGGDEELLAGKPAAGIDDDVADVSGGMIENNIVDFAQLLVVQAIKMRAANIISCVRNAGVFQGAVVGHLFLLGFVM